MEGGIDDFLLETEDEIIAENRNIVEDEMLGDDGIVVPKVGMIFLAVKMKCRRPSTATGSVRPQPTIQTNCKARISASSDDHGSWRINAVHLDHNHGTSPSKSRLFRCNRELSAQVKRRLEVNDVVGIPLHKSYNSAVVEAGGYENMTCVEKDCRNYIEQVRRLRLGEGDAAAIQAYFSNMQAHCSGFYFSIDLDDESRLRNIFWADNRCRHAYKEFGDMVTFDTTYLTNKYDMPFAPFVGVNHHGQSTLLGCGLLSNEDTNSFVWLFRSWLQCMHSVAPHGIITDQDRAMQNAIQIVFPNTNHRWCLWHILKKLPEKFGYHIDKGSIFSDIHGLVYDSQFVEEFEEGWIAMINKFGLHENDWLSGLYENRKRWVPCLLKITFWAGMSTTQRSESMNAFFDGYVHSKTSLKQFVEQYERALRNKVEKEFQADFKSYSQMLPCVSMFEMEKQFQSVYTISKFKEVQEEFIGKMYCDLISTSENSFGTMYEVCEVVACGERMKKKTFFVSFQKENCQFICSCHLFEFRGIICRHAISVLIRNCITSIPERYILRRWRRDVSRAHARVAVNYAGLVSTPSQLRYDSMCQSFAGLADLAADDDGQTRAIIDWIESQCTVLTLTRTSTSTNVLAHHTVQLGPQCNVSQNTLSGSVRDPLVSRRKGAPKKLRSKSPLESSLKKVKATLTSSKGKRPNSSQSATPVGTQELQASQH
ncbi:protein FAR1-RELATED SEQUENCE 5-like [Olea europaea var. sylvestris]|uniref:protein FAR1-RELATED SEQUENCE 5-like n=1 Tax=Olea europaea var. sylvestris TaxID=158386 RepID=UPI000C1D2885|nr:protein FAR1-RELATED SEQUENCE 5-like [Olea europaea var. sylvestris]